MQLDHVKFNLGIFGAGGYGKTTYAINFLKGSKAAVIFIFDPEGEFSLRLQLPPCRTVFELEQALSTGWVCFDPHTMFPGEMEKALDFISEFAIEVCKRIKGRKFFVADELGWYMSGAALPKQLKIVAQSGRRYGLDCVFIGQAPNELHNTLRNGLTEVVCFQLQDDCALEFPEKFRFNISEIRNLPPHKFIARTKQGGELRN